ncbi:hypothetical protein AB4089_09855 [Arthrobacter sp. 2MCAF15]
MITAAAQARPVISRDGDLPIEDHGAGLDAGNGLLFRYLQA